MSQQQSNQPQQSASATHWRKVHRRQNVDFLFAEDLGGRRSVDVEIVESGVKPVKTANQKSKPMPYLVFKGSQKKLGLNATNCKAMQAITGTGIIEQWRGWITLTVVQTKYKDQQTGRDEVTDAIRIAPKRPKGKPGGDADLPPVPPADEAPDGDHGDDPDEEEQRLIEHAEREANNG